MKGIPTLSEVILVKQIDELKDEFHRLGQHGQAAYVIISATDLENILEELLKSRMRKLSKELDATLFERNGGAFNGFANKIDAAFALGMIGKQTQRDLHALRAIRNKFAHTRERLHYDKEEVAKLFTKFSDYKGHANKQQFFAMKVEEVRNDLQKGFRTIGALARLAMSDEDRPFGFYF